MAKEKKPIFLDDDFVEWEGRLIKMVPVLGVGAGTNAAAGRSLLSDLSAQIAAEIERALNKASGSALHGALVSGQASEDGLDTWGTWHLHGDGPDGRNCDGCLELAGSRMTEEQFLDTIYTTQCDGNCRCRFIADGKVKPGESVAPTSEADLALFDEVR